MATNISKKLGGGAGQSGRWRIIVKLVVPLLLLRLGIQLQLLPLLTLTTNFSISSTIPISNILHEVSPACKPHFQLAAPPSSNNTQTNIFVNSKSASKFTRLYFHHARKAGGTSLRQYFKAVAQHHGLAYAVNEYGPAEEPGTHENSTLYVTHLRDPVRVYDSFYF